MKVHYIDRKVQIKHFSDLSIISDLKEESYLNLKIPAQENFVIQLTAVAENETEITNINIEGNSKIYCLNTQIKDKFGVSYTKNGRFKKEQYSAVVFYSSC